jgi:UDP-N-acetyl-2-amino-2-deoxyglucuronate dehydrogenase
VQIVVIGTPSGAHMEPAVAAAKAGKHVIVEKPLEITLKRCDKIIEACRANNVTLSTIFPSRFHDSAVEIKRAMEAGRFGQLTVGDAYVKWYRTQQYYDSGKWLLWLMGPVAEVTAQAAMLAHERIAVEDTVVATLKFESGALGVIEATTAAFPGYLKRIEIHGSAGSAVMEEEDIVKWDFAKEQKRDAAIRAAAAAKKSGGGGASDPAAIGHHGHARQFADILDAIKKGRAPRIDGPQGRTAVEVILAIYKAAETGRAVRLPLAGDPVLKARKQYGRVQT